MNAPGPTQPPRPSTPELLAPAGDRECLRAAAANGADAVYFGLGDFNARRRATNFTLDELPETLAYLHERNVRGYVALNTLVFSHELPDVQRYVAAIAAAGADAVIVQDLGLARLIHAAAPTLPLHASTQMTLSHPQGTAFVRELGVSRVILARELSVERIAALRRQSDLELEVFVHGALCISYSGQCHASGELLGRSANRGQCAQLCRLPYRLLVDGRPRDTGDRTYLLSPQDLAAHERLGALIDAGVAGFKIEGRLKRAPYVAAAVRAYRTLLDHLAAGRAAALDEAQRRELAQSFSRGFSTGWLDGRDHQGLVQGRFPKSRGVRVGRVAGRSERGVLVALEGGSPPPLRPGDGVVFDEGRPDRDEQGGRLFEVRPAGRGRLELRFGRGDVDLSAVTDGAVVWKTDDPSLRRSLERSYAADAPARREPLTARVEAAPGAPLTLALRDAAGREARAASDAPLEAARQHPLTAELLREQLGRLGGTPFELAAVELAGDANVMAPKSVLNDLRRRAVEQLLAARAAAARHPLADADALATLRAKAARTAGPAGAPAPLHVLARTAEQHAAVRAWVLEHPGRVATLYADFADLDESLAALAPAREAGLAAGVATARILEPGEEGALVQPITQARPDAVLVRNLAALRLLRASLPEATLVGDASLNVANDLSVALLTAPRPGGAWLARVTPAADAGPAELAALVAQADPAAVELVVHERRPLFHTAYCLFAAHLSGGRDCRTCGRPCKRHELELLDRNGERLPVRVDPAGRNTVYAPAGRDLPAEAVRAALAHGVRHLRLELLDEPPGAVPSLLERLA